MAKVHKVAERVGAQERVRGKDALDVLRLLRAVETRDLARRVATVAQSQDLRQQFGSPTRTTFAPAVPASSTRRHFWGVVGPSEHLPLVTALALAAESPSRRSEVALTNRQVEVPTCDCSRCD